MQRAGGGAATAKRARSEDLSKTKGLDEGGYDGGHDSEEERDMFERMQRHQSTTSVWREGGAEKDAILQTLIQKFGMIIQRRDDDDDGEDEEDDGDDGTVGSKYVKLPSASKAIAKISKCLIDNENFETKDFTLFIARKNWVRTILVPLIELSCKDDREIVDKSFRLIMTLLRGLRENTRKALSFDLLKAKAKDMDSEELESRRLAKANAVEQISALLSFKEAVCTEQCAFAMVSFFGKAWEAEIIKEVNEERTKQDMAKAFSYVRRLLDIRADTVHSSPGEQQRDKIVHHKLVVHLRSLLFALPGILGDLDRKMKNGDRYHDDWINDVLRIVNSVLRGHTAKDLYLVWREGGLLTDSESVSMAGLGVGDGEAALPVIVPKAIQLRHITATKGLLSGQLRQQRSDRQAAIGMVDSRNGRFGGLFVKPVPQNQPTAGAPQAGLGSSSSSKENDTANNTKEDEDPALAAIPVGQAKAKAIVKRGVFLNSNTHVFQAKARRSKRMITFAQDGAGGGGEAASEDTLANEHGQRACVVVASLVDTICTAKALNAIIIRVNEDARRDEGIIRDDMELAYYEILAHMLQYNRLKLADAKLKHNESAEKGHDVGTWQPDITNLSEMLSQMSRDRVLFSLEILYKKKAFADIVKPLEVYKEIICYLRVLLESSNPGHNDIAVAYLYRLFYTTTERKDPLGRLLSEWRPATYSRHHLNVLVELVHETMKTLDMAKRVYSAEGHAAEKDRRKRSQMKGNLDLEQYVSAALRFSVDEYFKRLVSNQTVRIYTKLLEKYASNPHHVNYYASTFLQRMCSFRLEQEYPAPFPAGHEASGLSQSQSQVGSDLTLTPVPSEDLTLMFMLFNVHTLTIFSTMLNDCVVATQQHMASLLRLIKQVVRRFGEAASKNRLLFVEALFRQPHPHAFCEKLDNVYEAQAYRMGIPEPRSRNYDDAYSTSGSDDDDDNAGAAKGNAGGAGGGGDDEDGDEAFNEDSIKAVTKESLRKKRLEEKRRAKGDKPRSGGSREGGSRKSKEKVGKRAWSKEEDRVLKDLYKLYAGTHAVFFSIAEDETFRAFGKNRSTDAVSRRVKELNLHMELGANDDDDPAAPNDDDATQSQPWRGAPKAASPPAQRTDRGIDRSGRGGGGSNSSSSSSSSSKQKENWWDEDDDDDDDAQESRKRPSPTLQAATRKLQKKTVASVRKARAEDSDSDGLMSEDDGEVETQTQTQTLPHPAADLSQKRSRRVVDSDDE